MGRVNIFGGEGQSISKQGKTWLVGEGSNLCSGCSHDDYKIRQELAADCLGRQVSDDRLGFVAFLTTLGLSHL